MRQRDLIIFFEKKQIKRNHKGRRAVLRNLTLNNECLNENVLSSKRMSIDLRAMPLQHYMSTNDLVDPAKFDQRKQIEDPELSNREKKGSPSN